jgi:hypothetical protein
MNTPQTLLNHQSATFAEGAHGFVDRDRMRGRFADRTKRLARRQESDIFRHYLMPVSLILGFAGLLGLCLLWIAEGVQAMTHSPALPVLVPLFAAPVLTALIRVVRGHFHPAVREL